MLKLHSPIKVPKLSARLVKMSFIEIMHLVAMPVASVRPAFIRVGAPLMGIIQYVEMVGVFALGLDLGLTWKNPSQVKSSP